MTVDEMADWEVVEKAADIAEARGVCAGPGGTCERAQVCIDVALCMALGYDEVHSKMHYIAIINERDVRAGRIARRMADALGLPPNDYGTHEAARLYCWNDAAVLGPDHADYSPTSALAEVVARHPNVLDGARYAAKVMRLEDEGAA